MASISGNWFHSRSSSNLSELETVRKMVLRSQIPRYIGMVWSGGRYANQLMFDFVEPFGIKPSTMQTKIRAMIRYGFVRDGNTFPLVWTRMGSLWNDLYSLGNYTSAKKIYELTLTISLALFAFDSSDGFCANPSNGEMPLRFLLNNLDSNNAISLRVLEVLIDGETSRVGKNYSYWKTDLLNSGLFMESPNQLVYTGKYSLLVQEIKEFQPNRMLSDADWNAVRDNPLIEFSPFKKSLREIFEEISQEQTPEQPAADALSEPIIDAISEQDEVLIPEIDILSTDTRYAHSPRRVRNQIWSTRIKKKYLYTCAVPNCDVTGQIFVEAAHIKPDSAPEYGIPHRSHILNGLCLCRHCHIAFEKGFFTLTDDYKILTSSRFEEIPDQNIKTVILSSSDQIIKSRSDHRLPLVEFIQFHRNNQFKP